MHALASVCVGCNIYNTPGVYFMRHFLYIGIYVYAPKMGLKCGFMPEREWQVVPNTRKLQNFGP